MTIFAHTKKTIKYFSIGVSQLRSLNVSQVDFNRKYMHIWISNICFRLCTLGNQLVIPWTVLTPDFLPIYEIMDSKPFCTMSTLFYISPHISMLWIQYIVHTDIIYVFMFMYNQYFIKHRYDYMKCNMTPLFDFLSAIKHRKKE